MPLQPMLKRALVPAWVRWAEPGVFAILIWRIFAAILHLIEKEYVTIDNCRNSNLFSKHCAL